MQPFPGLTRAALAAFIALVGLGLAGCSGHAAPAADVSAGPPAPSPFIEVAPAAAGSEAWSSALPGRLVFRPLGLAAVASPVAARIVSIQTRPGANVTAGEPLLTLQSSEVAKARAELAEAKAKSAAAQDVLRRQIELMQNGVGLEVERFAAETAAREAQVELERARRTTALVGEGEGDRFELRAPASGVVMSLRATVGAVVSPDDDALAEIGDPHELWVQADVPESGLRDVQEGRKAEVRLNAADTRFVAEVEGIGGRVDGEQRRVAVYLRPDGAVPGLVPGMLAEVRLDLGPNDSAISLPVEAVLIKNGSDRIVYVQDAQGGFAARPVRTGVARDGHVPILDGLRPGEKVVVRGALLLDAEADQLL